MDNNKVMDKTTVAMIFFIAVIIRNYKLGKKNNQVEVGESNV